MMPPVSRPRSEDPEPFHRRVKDARGDDPNQAPPPPRSITTTTSNTRMHPFCCATPIPVSPAAATPTPMPPPPSPPPPGSAAACSRDPSPHSNGFLRSVSLRSSFHEALLNGDHREAQLNDVVGSGISGILHKWVNYGRGWRPRWFVLQDGVLSFYKIHGPHRIELNQETKNGSKVIGEESLRRISRRHKANGHGSHFQRKPVGEVHLKVSSIRESRSDDKRFSIFTGTKRLHLRAETREDRMVWMEALQAVKEMFPRISNCELMTPVDNFVVSTEKLRERLQQEGLSETAIQDSEQITRTEFASIQNQLVLLKQKQSLLIDTLRQLEAVIQHNRGSCGLPDVTSGPAAIYEDNATCIAQIQSDYIK